MRVATLLLAGLALVGCQAWQMRPVDEQLPACPQAEDRMLMDHLDFIQALNSSDAAQREAAYRATSAAFEVDSGLSNRLRLAWVWATPGHANSNLWAARKQLQEVINSGQLSARMERLARVQLVNIERNLRLQNKLSEADAKIRALTTLEHSMEERDAKVQEE